MNLIDLLIDFTYNATEKDYIEFFGEETYLEWMSRFELGANGTNAYIEMSQQTCQRFASYLTNRWALPGQPEFCTEYPMSEYAIFCDTSEAETEVIV